METKDYLRLLKEEIHSTVIATADGEGRPVTRVIDIMLDLSVKPIFRDTFLLGWKRLGTD